MNYSDEEIEAIEQLKSWRDYIIKNKDKVNKANDIEFYLRTVLNLIQKQEKENTVLRQGLEENTKEIEELNLKNEKLYEDNLTLAQEIKQFIEGTNDVKYYSTSFIKNHYTSNDKIKAKIEEIDKKYEISKDENGESPYYYPNFTIRILQSLLEKTPGKMSR
ncbi:MAG: hypothetical protein IJH39_01250 [Clostridia bacterium]|nr:hypothetical protein [Clostridia bacterium]